jgi:DNA-directed RNA polymerase specialized sigma24 family protein
MERAAGTIMGEPGDADVGRDVVERVKGGDPVAWRWLVGEHVELIAAVCRSYGLACEAARQVNQMVWLRLAEHLPRIRTPDTVGGWIAATARAECLSPRYTTGRSGWVVAGVGIDDDGDGNDGDEQSDGSGAVPTSSHGRALVAAFGRLGSRCQQLLRLLLTIPDLRDEHVGAALDVAPDDVERLARSCLTRLARIAGLDVDVVRHELGRLMVSTTVSDHWWDAADAAFAWFTTDAAYAELVYDSRAARSGLRPRMRQLRYATGLRGIELALDARDGEVMLTGRVAPADPVTVTARWPDGAQSADADDAGVFHLHGLPPRPLSLQLASAPPLKTGWLLP